MKRYTWIDIAKGLGILLVVLGHTRFPPTEVDWWINSFHMPLFFVVAGLCYDETRYPGILSYLRRKAVALAYPYFTLSLLAIGLVGLLYLGPVEMWTPQQMLKNMLHGSPGGAFWFITVLLEVEVAYAVFSRFVRKPCARLILLLAVSLSAAYWIPGHLPYFIDTALVALFFYGLGHFCRAPVNMALAVPRVEHMALIISVAAVVVDAVLLLFFYRYKATFAARDLKEPAFYFLLAVLGTVALLAFSVAWDKIISGWAGWRGGAIPLQWCSGAIRFLGRNTIIILAFHNFLGLCRSSWHMNGLLSQMLEFAMLGLLLWLLSGPLHILVSPRSARR